MDGKQISHDLSVLHAQFVDKIAAGDYKTIQAMIIQLLNDAAELGVVAGLSSSVLQETLDKFFVHHDQSINPRKIIN